MPLRNLIILAATVPIALLCSQKASHSRYAAVLSDAMEQIQDRYVEPIGRRELFEGAMQGMVGRLDPYSAYISPQPLKELQEMVLEQQFGGVGIEVLLDPETKRLTVLSPLFGTPAHQAGIKAGDVILEIDGHSTDGFALEDAVQLMRGDPGTQVRLRILPLGEKTSRELTIAREDIRVESVIGDVRGADGRWRFFLAQHPRIGYIRLTTFGDKTVAELTEALKFADHPVEALILDLRGNAGGLLDAAVSVADLFLDEGQIVSTRDRYGRVFERFSARRETTVCRLPMAVLVDRYSASSSEIVAASLQDDHRAPIIGKRTWGKGTVQNVIFLEGGRSAVKLTTLTYWRPSLKNIHRGTKATEEDDWGVRPDTGHEVSLSDEEYAKLILAQGQRQLARVKQQNGAARPPGGPEASTPAAETDVQDPFMRKAVQYLEGLQASAGGLQSPVIKNGISELLTRRSADG